MYINIVEKENKKAKNGTSCYVYLCESKREQGKVKTNKKYLYSFEKSELSSILKTAGIIQTLSTMLYFQSLDETTRLKLTEELTKKIYYKQYILLQDPYWKKYYDNEYNTYKNCNDKNVTTEENKDNVQDFMKEIINAGYKALTKKYHPDAGGTNEEFVKLQKAKDELLNRL